MNIAEIDNALIHLKDRLLQSINASYDEKPMTAYVRLAGVLEVLEQTEELFQNLAYGYKTAEIADRVTNAAAHQISQLGSRHRILPAKLEDVSKRAYRLMFPSIKI